MINHNKLSLNFGARFALFCCFTLIGFIICGFFSFFATIIWGINTLSLRISTIIQDIILFIAPAIISSIFITRLPADFLQLRKFPSLKFITLTLLIIVLSIPLMNFIVHCNQSITFPDALKNFESTLISMELENQKNINILLGFDSTSSIINLIISILIVGVLTGLSEELFFRGALQNIFRTKPMSIHSAIWITAVIFSALHFQFYGFIPRVLLGAFFGYLALWSGSLWLPIIAHAFNNTMVVISTWAINENVKNFDINKIGTEFTIESYILIAISAIATFLGILILYRHSNLISK